MSYYMDQFDQAFRISAENKAAAFEALKGWALKEMERNAAYAHLGRSLNLTGKPVRMIAATSSRCASAEKNFTMRTSGWTLLPRTSIKAPS